MKKIIVGLLLLVTLSTLNNGISYADKRPVKLWPLYYHEEDPKRDLKETDIMWPIFLKKQKGNERRFAIRPLYITKKNPAKDFKKTDILWPIYCLEKSKENKEGRIFPLLWYGTKSGKLDYLTLFPLYWQGEDYLTIFPVFWKGKDYLAIFPIFWKGKGYCVVVPIYGKGKDFVTVFPPIFWKGKDDMVIFPFWWQGKNYITFFPIYWQGETSKGKRFIVIFPVYWHAKDKFWFVFPAGGRIGKGDKYTDFILWPLYVKSKDKETRTLNFIWPIISFKWGERNKGSRILPLYGYYNYSIQGKTKTFAFFSLYWFSKDKYISKDLKHVRKDKDYGLFPLYWYGREYRKYKDDRLSKSKHHFVFPLYWYDKKHIKRGDTNLSKSRNQVVFPLYWDDKDEWPNEGLSCRAVKFFPLFTYHRWKNDKVRFSLLWPLWMQEWDDPEIEETYAIFWRLWDYQKDKEGNTRTRVVGRLYRREKRANYKSTELMPFFTSEKEGKEKRHFAIFWRFFEYERDGKEKSLRFFYLPKFPSWGAEEKKEQKE